MKEEKAQGTAPILGRASQAKSTIDEYYFWILFFLDSSAKLFPIIILISN